MPHENQILTTPDREVLIANLEQCLRVFDKKGGLLNVAELRAKSMLSAVRNELERHNELQQRSSRD
jgi:hypothetical protein